MKIIGSSGQLFSIANAINQLLEEIDQTILLINKKKLDINKFFQNTNFLGQEPKIVFDKKKFNINDLEAFIKDLQYLHIEKLTLGFDLGEYLKKITALRDRTNEKIAAAISARQADTFFEQDKEKTGEDCELFLCLILQRIKSLMDFSQRELAKNLKIDESFFGIRSKRTSNVSFKIFKNVFEFLETKDTPIVLIFDEKINEWKKELTPLLSKLLAKETPFKKMVILLRKKDPSITQLMLNQKVELWLGEKAKLSHDRLKAVFTKQRKKETAEITAKKKRAKSNTYQQDATKIFVVILEEGKRLGINNEQEFVRHLQEIEDFYKLNGDDIKKYLSSIENSNTADDKPSASAHKRNYYDAGNVFGNTKNFWNSFESKKQKLTAVPDTSLSTTEMQIIPQENPISPPSGKSK